MQTKVDSSFFEDELDRLKNLLNQLASSGGEVKQIIQTGPTFNSKDFTDKLKQL
jgi:hypothetical protein